MSRLLKFDDFANGRRQSNEDKPRPTNTPMRDNPNTKPRQPLDEAMKALVWKGVMESNYFTSDEKTGIYHAMKKAGVTRQALNESILTRMREMLPKLKDEGTEVKEESIDKLEKVMKSAGAFSKYLADLVMKAWDRILGFYKSKLEQSKSDVFARVKLMRREGKDINNNINAELSYLKEVVMFWLKQFPAVVSKSILQNYSKAIMKESLEVSADVHTTLMKFSPSKINEQNDALWAFMDEITDKLKGIEPFKSLVAVGSFDGTAPEKFTEAFTKFTADCGGPAQRKCEMLPFVMEEVVKYRDGSVSKDMRSQILKSEGVLKYLPMNLQIITIIEALAMSVISMEAMLKLKSDGESVYKK